ncbi:MAG: leucyl aminopeptidase family protein, partial [Pseudomonadota bacterium]
RAGAGSNDERPRLKAPDGVDSAAIERQADADAWARDLINTPANDLGPEELAEAWAQLAQRHGAAFEVITGDALRDGFPLIHAVGRASVKGPRLIDLRWGDPGAPAVTLVGKGVCFDSGGLNIKTGDYMALMKKDMGGAAHVFALAHLIMASGLPVRLRALVPAVENAVSGDAFRPGDVAPSRKGLSVEIFNTDAEGRLILADALAYAGEEEGRGGLIIQMATLTGAARVALGPDPAPFYTDNEALSGELTEAAAALGDPVWRLPLWEPYASALDSPVADLCHTAKSAAPGSIIAALFLKRFAPDPMNWLHFDIYAWNRQSRPGRPEGGVLQGVRALFEMLERRFRG